ncbi:glycoside hydrolase family 2 protein [Amycolatopsis nalaikhensis]|uniref:Glycoside hydrolase family 2 TIM barrel-domain containing protein n=1 Tax=Amycolatopsis nalaikhensis TaxID=715472 RepID=A0ABY8XHP1_9PSEU|nr:glycoside hydrolase family 2 TIM barrel-domain containing protein [Amycolatopsis sp. 2-2]WIV55139.1 glycoside hydrolase family 2 TIM barrel-domain containing protein [Amycolatopsis sp. 2-2]
MADTERADSQPRLSRRGFLAASGAALLGAVVAGSAGNASPDPDWGRLGDFWLFGRYADGATEPGFDETDLAPVQLPHCVTPLSWTGWQPSSWQDRWIYRKHFTGTAAERFVARFDGVMTNAEVHLNGGLVATHQGGYLPFEVELPGVVQGDNVLAVVVDGRWALDVPPNLPRSAGPSVIDFYQPAGIYRPAAISAVPRVRLADVFARPVDVLSPGRSLHLTCTLDGPVTGEVTASVRQGGRELARATAPVVGTTVEFDVGGLGAVRLWDVEDPALCDVVVSLRSGPRELDQRVVRTGFREARFTPDGFFLNGRRLKLFGLNRHQWYPFAGGALPDRVQRRDAEILRRELNCTMVRCSHYPQSSAFLDACDELGLLVWEEIPGWGRVGDDVWQEQNLRDVTGMITRDRNHPSIVIWGTRVNEANGTTALYGRTGRLARQLDPSRPTSGALASTTLARYAGDDIEVLAYNDYTARRGAPFQLRPPRPGVPYLVTESIGTLAGARAYRRSDPAAARLQAELHAKAHDLAAADDRYCGLLAWCAFDYPSGWQRSVDGSKYAGVSDIFRIPKPAAAFYASQGDPLVCAVVEPGFAWDFTASPTGPGPGATIWSNCDRLALFLDDRPVGEARSRRADFPHLAHPPFAVDLTVRRGQRPQLRIDGYTAGRLVVTRRFSGDRSRDVLSCTPDDTRLRADGSDATRVVIAATDRFGVVRAGATGEVSLTLTGPGDLIGDRVMDLGATGGAAAVWVRPFAGPTGTLTLTARHEVLGVATATVTATEANGTSAAGGSRS